MTSMGFSIHGHRFSQVVYSLFLLRCFRRESCFKQTVKQNNKIPSLEKIQYNSKNTNSKKNLQLRTFFQQQVCHSPSTGRHRSQTAPGHFPTSSQQSWDRGLAACEGWSQGWISDLLPQKPSYIPLYHRDRYQI